MPAPMGVPVRAETGQGVVELLAAMAVLTIALLALAAGYDTAAISLHNAGRKTEAAKLADGQMELYASLPFGSIGLDQTALANVTTAGNPAYDPTYVTDEAALNAASSGTDVTIAGCGSAPQCQPVQTVTGPDGHGYVLETFVRDVVSTGSWKERVVTVIVRDPGASGTPELFRETAGFDPGP